MAGPNLGTAASQLALMLQKVQPDVENSQNLDRELDEMFSSITAQDIGLEKYRHPIQVEVGGTGGSYQPDGGSYFQGQGAKTDQFIIAPTPILVVFSATELLRRIGAGGKDVVDYNPVARMISDAKDKTAHYRNAYLQGYNNGVIGTIDTSYAGGTVVQMATVPFGARLINISDVLQVTDTNFNVVATINVLDVSNTTVGGIDTITVDNAAGLVAGYFIIPIGLASGTPIGWQGLQYIVSPQTNLEYCGVARTLSYVQAPAYNANGAFLTLGVTSAFKTRMIQSLGIRRFNAKNVSWYGHPVQRTSAETLGFAKSFYMLQDGKVANYDIGAPTGTDDWMLCGIPVKQDSMAAVDKLYWLSKSTLRRVRYPGSQKFIPGLQDGLWWPRQSGGLYTSEYDLMYQDSVNYYSKLPRANGVIHALGLQPSLGAAA